MSDSEGSYDSEAEREWKQRCEERLAALGDNFLNSFDDAEAKPVKAAVGAGETGASSSSGSASNAKKVRKKKKKKGTTSAVDANADVGAQETSKVTKPFTGNGDKKGIFDDWADLVTPGPASSATSELLSSGKKKKKKGKNVADPTPLLSKLQAQNRERSAQKEKEEEEKRLAAEKEAKRKAWRPPREKKCDFMSGSLSRMKKKPQGAQTLAPGDKKRTEAMKEALSQKKDFNETLRAMLDFVVPKMEKHQRKQYENQKIRALGGKLEKTPHESYKLIQRRAEKRKVRQADLKKQEAELGVRMTVNNGMNTQQALAVAKKKAKRLKDAKNNKHILSEVGFEKGGMLKVRKNIVKKYNNA